MFINDFQTRCDNLIPSLGVFDRTNIVGWYLEFRKERIAELEAREEAGQKIEGFLQYPSIMALQDLSMLANPKHSLLDELVIYNGPTIKSNSIINIISDRYPKFTNTLYWSWTAGEQYYTIDVEDGGKISFTHKKDALKHLCQVISDDLEEYVCAIELSSKEEMYSAICTFRVWLRQVVDNGCTEPFKNLWSFYRRQNMIMPAKRTTMKAGKFLKMVDPSLTEKQISILASDIVDLARLYDAKSDKVQVTDEFEPYNQKAALNSCMQGKDSRFFEIYRKLPQCRLAYIESEDGFLLARAIIWDEVHTADGKTIRIMDRIYANNVENNVILQRWAVDNGYLFKTQPGMFSDGKGIHHHEDIYIDLSEFNVVPEDMEYLPYMDTFRHYVPGSGKIYSEYKLHCRSMTVQDGKVGGINKPEK